MTTKPTSHFNQSALHVSGFSRLDSRVNKTFSSSDCVEEHLRWSQSGKEAVAYEASSGRILGYE